MERLTETSAYSIPAGTFKRCQVCGWESDDICSYHMWWESDDDDSYDPDTSPILITCRSEACLRVIEEHERLYVRVPWSAGGPGRFILLCGPCKYRDGTRCTHPKLTANGGEGLTVYLWNRAPANTMVCGTRGCAWVPSIATDCEGLKEG